VILRKFFNQHPLLATNITFLLVVLQVKRNILYKERGNVIGGQMKTQKGTFLIREKKVRFHNTAELCQCMSTVVTYIQYTSYKLTEYKIYWPFLALVHQSN
jgi:hypothetical protein